MARRRPKTNNVLRCGLLTRVSTEMQARDPEGSLKSQLQRLRAFLDAKRASGVEAEEVRVYSVPEGASGKTLERRDVQDAIADIQAGRINCLVVTELSRLSRSVLDFLKFMEFLREHDCGLISIKQQFDTTTPHGKLLITICVALAEFERELVSERTSENIKARAERGLYNGGYLLTGYDPDPKNKGNLVVNEQEAAITQLAFNLYEQHVSDAKVMEILNERGYRTKRFVSKKGKPKGGLPWTLNTVAYLLTNPTYAGLKEINKKQKTKNQDDLVEEDRYRTVPGVWPAIIPHEQFDRVQRLRAENARIKRSVAAPVERHFLLQGLLVCDYCGHTLEPASGTGKDGKLRYYYRHSRRAPKNCPIWKSIPAEQAERLVTSRLNYLGRNIELVEEIVAAASANLQAEVPEVLRRLRERQARLSAIQTDVDGLLTLATAMPEGQRREFLEPRLAKLAEERRATESEIALLDASQRELKTNTVSAVDLQAALQTFETLFQHLEPYKQKELLGYLVQEARISAEAMTLTLFGKASAETIALQRNGAKPTLASFAPTPIRLLG